MTADAPVTDVQDHSGPPAEADPAPAPERPTTGHADVDAALDRLLELETLPVAEHVAVYEDVQQRLADALARPVDQPADQPADQPGDQPADQPGDRSSAPGPG